MKFVRKPFAQLSIGRRNSPFDRVSAKSEIRPNLEVSQEIGRNSVRREGRRRGEDGFLFLRTISPDLHLSSPDISVQHDGSYSWGCSWVGRTGARFSFFGFFSRQFSNGSPMSCSNSPSSVQATVLLVQQSSSSRARDVEWR